MPTVTINTVDYDVYADIETADEYLAADFSADGWRAETDTDKKRRADVTATRLIDRMLWAGDKTDADQLHAFPRTGIAGLDEDTVPPAIIAASIVLAKLIHAGSQVDSQPSTHSGNIKRQQAGSVSIEYFLPTDDPTRLPVEVLELIGPFLPTASFGGALAFGTCGTSITDRDHSFEPGWPTA